MGFEEDIERRVSAKRAGMQSVADQSAAALEQCMGRWSELVETAQQAAALLMDRGVPFTPDVGGWCSSTGAPWPEGWQVDSTYSSTGRAVLTTTGEIKIVIDHDSYSPTREEKNYLDFLKGQLESDYWLALNDPHPHNEERLKKLERQAKGITVWSGSDVVILEALKDDVADLLARQ